MQVPYLTNPVCLATVHAPGKQVPEKQLLTKTKLRRSPLGIGYHVRDMLGLGLLQRVSTTSGTIIRLVGQR